MQDKKWRLKWWQFVIGVLIGIIISSLGYICFCGNIKKNISIWEIIASTLGALITLAIFDAWNQIKNKKYNKDLLFQELAIIELSLKDMDELILSEFKGECIWTKKIQIILQSKIIYIANKVEYIIKQLDNSEFLLEWNNFRDAITEKFWWRRFKLDDDYIILFTKNYTKILTNIIGIKKQIINW